MLAKSLKNFCVNQERPCYFLETKPSRISGVQNRISVPAHAQHRCTAAHGNPGEPGLEEGTTVSKAVSPLVRALAHWPGWSHAHPTRGCPGGTVSSTGHHTSLAEQLLYNPGSRVFLSSLSY